MLSDKYFKNPVKDWLVEYHPVIMSVVDKLNITHVDVLNVSHERFCWGFLRAHDGEPISRADARSHGVTEEELKSFDQQVDSDNLIVVIDWKPVPFSFEEEMED